MNELNPLLLIIIAVVGLSGLFNMLVFFWPDAFRRGQSTPVAPPVEPTAPKQPSQFNPLVAVMGLAIVVLAVMVLYQPASAPPDVPPEVGKVDLYTPFSKSPDHGQAASDAAIFGDLCGSLADTLEFDGAQADPYVVKGVQADNLRLRARHYQFRGRSLSQTYPGLPEAVKTYMDAVVGAEVGGELDPQTRMKFIGAFRELERSANIAARQLL